MAAQDAGLAGRHDRAARWLSSGWLGACLFWCAAAAATPAPVQEVVVIDTAQASLEPAGAPRRDGAVDLGRRWDREFPGLGGRAVYRIALPPRAGSEPMAVLFSRVGNQVHVQLNGSTVRRWGVLGDPEFDAAKSMVTVVLPAALLRADRANELQVEVTIQPQRSGGLSVLRYGPHPVIEALRDDHHRWRDAAMLVFAASLFGMGALTALLWWRQRDALYGWFSLAAFFGVVRNVDRVWPDVPLPWPVLGVLVTVCFLVHIALICRVTLMAIGPISRVMGRVVGLVIVVASVLTVLAYTLGMPSLLTLALIGFVPLGIATLTLIMREALAGTRRGRAWVLASAVALATGAGVYDLGLIRIGDTDGLRNTLTQHALFVFVLIMGGLLAQRYSGFVANYHALNADLSRRIEVRERQLHDAFDVLRERQHEQSVSVERQRIMREIHDGVGSQLVGLLNMVARPGADPAVLQEHVQSALDEMRLAVDSLQPVHDDLLTVLATLRYRLQPRLQAAGIAVVWDVTELPALRQLSPDVVLHVQRILLEAFTNVLKHAHASQVTVSARWSDGVAPEVTLRIEDNGVGLGGAEGTPGLRRGRGVDNMRARAEAIGATVRVEHGADGGVCVTLDWRVEPPALDALSAGAVATA